MASIVVRHQLLIPQNDEIALKTATRCKDEVVKKHRGATMQQRLKANIPLVRHVENPLSVACIGQWILRLSSSL